MAKPFKLLRDKLDDHLGRRVRNLDELRSRGEGSDLVRKIGKEVVAEDQEAFKILEPYDGPVGHPSRTETCKECGKPYTIPGTPHHPREHPNPPVAAAIKTLLDHRARIDPNESVPTYDLHGESGRPTNYALVRVDWLDELWRDARPGEFMPHDHIDPSDLP